jgi:hypothetical protein
MVMLSTRVQRLGQRGVRPVEEHLGVRLGDPVARYVGQWRIPVVAGEDLVGALPGLHHLDVLGHLLRQQVEGDTVVADHRLAHRRHRTGQGGQQPGVVDLDLVVIGAEVLSDQIGVGELVAGLATRRMEADAERGQALLSRLGEQRHDQAGVQAAGQQYADRHVGDHPAVHGGPQ